MLIRQRGIIMPRDADVQAVWSGVIPVERKDLQPGDLVFFGYNGDAGQIHHVGMYVGSSDFIEAPASGEVVRISSLVARIESRGDYVGAARP